MIHKLFKIDLDRCTDLVVRVFHDTIELSRFHRLEFITPEVLFYCIIRQENFISYSAENHVDVLNLMKELQDYISGLDCLPDEEELGIPSNQFQRLITLVNMDWEAVNHTLSETLSESEGNETDEEQLTENEEIDPITIPDLLYRIDDLDNTYAQFLIRQYLEEDSEEWYEDLRHHYYQDIENYHKNHKGPIKKDREPSLSVEERKQRLQEASARLMNAINIITGKNINSAEVVVHANLHRNENDPEPEDEETTQKNGSPHRSREAWEDLVTLLNETYAQKNPLIGREKELTRAIRILCRREKNNPLFIGESGVGKTALIYGLTRMIEEGQVPEWLKGQQVYALDMASLVAGTSYHGEFEKRMKSVLEGARKRGTCILYIDDIHTIAGNGGNNSSMSAVDILKPYLEDGSIRFIGSTTYQEYNKSIAANKSLARRFGQIDVKEPSISDTIRIIQGLIPVYEKHHGVKYTEEAIRYAVEQSDALINDRFLPDKAIDLIDEAGAFLQQNPLLNKNGIPKDKRYQKVGIEQIKTILTDVCRIDAKALANKGNEELKDLDQRIGHEIYGQDEAIRQVVRAVMMSKAGLGEPDKPLASLLFVGPTGVGKTEVCRVLAKELGVELVRFDMSEYTEKHTVSKLIGSPAGYVGYDEGGLLTDAIRKTPNCVLLLDEIEKAHTDIYNILLQVMDYAKLTDNKGNKADFRNVILIMTSNAGAQFANQASVGFSGGQSKGQAMLSTVKKTFKPEFLNRLSGTIVFNDMDKHMASLILDKKLRQLKSRLQAKEVEMTLTPEAHEFLLTHGFTSQYGAREMDRVIQQYLTPLLMEEILFGKLKKGGKVSIECSENQLSIR